MGDLVLKGATSGQITVTPTAVAGTNTLTLPAKTGNIITSADSGTVTPTMMTQPLTAMTSQASTSGTNIDFTSIPSWAKRITVMFNGVSTSGTNNILIQLGISSGPETSGYAGTTQRIGSSTTVDASLSNGFAYNLAAAAAVVNGLTTICLVNSASNIWAANGVLGRSDTTAMQIMGGVKSLSGALDRVRITTNGGTDTFDAGSINVFYE